MDLITFLTTSERFDLVFKFFHRFSQYVTFIPYKATCTALDLARKFYDYIVCKFGMPQKIVSNRDSRFLSEFQQALMHLLQYTLEISSGYHPQADGQSEHFHHSVESILHCYMTASQSNWVIALASAESALNSTVSVAHKKSPFVVFFWQRTYFAFGPSYDQLSNCTVQVVFEFISSQEKSFSDVHMALSKTNESMDCSFDKHCHDIQFNSGDLVYVNTAHFSSALGVSSKLAPKWVGHFPIEQVISPVVYYISLPEEYGHIHPVFHISSLHGHQVPPPSCPPPIFLVANSSQHEYEVEDILAQNVHHRYS